MSSPIDDLFGSDSDLECNSITQTLITRHPSIQGLFVYNSALHDHVQICNNLSSNFFPESNSSSAFSQFIVFGIPNISAFHFLLPVISAGLSLLDFAGIAYNSNTPPYHHPFDHCLANHYTAGSGIKPHVDLKRFGEAIIIASFGSTSIMEFRRAANVEGNVIHDSAVVEVFLRPGDVILMTGEARFNYTHGIPERKLDILYIFLINLTTALARTPIISLPLEWEVLGPFPIGSREVGADPLSAYGGFEVLPYNTSAHFPSELADNGYVTWQKIKTTEDKLTGEQVVGPVEFDNVRWEFNAQAFGWIALHHVIYFRGFFTVPETGVYMINMNQVSSFKIDSRAFLGNLYSYEHLAETPVYLKEGQHRMFVQTVMDIRIFGGSIPPRQKFSGSIVPVSNFTPQSSIIIPPQDSIFPEIIDSTFITPYASVTLMNTNTTLEPPLEYIEQPRKPRDGDPDQPSESHKDPWSDRDITLESELANTIGWVQIVSVDCFDKYGNDVPIRMTMLNSIKLAPGQMYPVPLEFPVEEGVNIQDVELDGLKIVFRGMKLDTRERFDVEYFPKKFKRRVWGDGYKITFLDYDGSVQYAMAKPPKSKCSYSKYDRCPIILALHGSGVEADSDFWLEAYNRHDQAWILYPTGRTTWGFDWHGPSYMNIQEALDALSELPGVPDGIEDDYLVDKNKLVYTGHSNGGQGAWWLVSHYPDLAVAAMPAAGFMKIQLYTPYFLRVGDAFADPTLRGILEASISEHDIDLYSSNLAGIPILARSGGSDDNVPPMHTRRMIRLVNEWARDPNIAIVSEIPTQGHWFDGVMSDDIMQSFLDKYLVRKVLEGEGRELKMEGGEKGELKVGEFQKISVPVLPHSFTLSTLNPASTGTKGGIRILQLEVPFRLGQIQVHQHGTMWILNTTNIRRFGFVDDSRRAGVTGFIVDGTEFPAPVVGPSYVYKEGTWQISSDLLWLSRERHPSTYGPAMNILKHPFLIVIPSTPTTTKMGTIYRQVAQHIAASWYLYGRGGTQIVRDVDVLDGLAARYNFIVLGGPEDNKWTRRREKEGAANLVRFLPDGYQISNRKYVGPGIGIIFSAPSPTRTRMGLFISGTDELGFMKAAWTIPFRTGLMVPDYMVFGDEYGDPSTGWTARDGAPYGGAGTKGAGGVYAAGYWNNTWEYDDRCGYLK
ncbi:hypothetical protein HK098_004132 [Nowakowskiella sp. JEL0407]|nr:hypothetical protein HK098_004132 [Nowakowskiella sp. JEL0407]